jgi:hypothetical protein
MSAGSKPGGESDTDLPPSRQSNESKSVKPSTAEIRPGEKQVDDCVKDFLEEFPERSRLDLATCDGTEIRREYANVETVEWEEDLRMSKEEREKLMLDRPAGTVDGEVSPKVWREGVRTVLEREAEILRTTINLERRYLNQTDTFDVSAKSRWHPDYQKTKNAQIDAWLRELCGGDRPSGGMTEGLFEEPRIAFLTLSASSIPNGERVGPVDHAKSLRESWEPVYHQMRNTLRSEGFDSEDWQYNRVAEPHKNERGDDRGINACYSHEHIILVIDAAAADGVSEGDLRPIVDKHVEKNEWAGEEAHGEDAVEVRDPEELNDPAAYVADYCSIDPVGLFERSPAYQAWAAAVTAANYRHFTRSEAAREAAEADKCRQRAESDESDQVRQHGEAVRRVDGEVVCVCCGTTHGIEQGQTLVEHRRPQSPSEAVTEPTVADGGSATEKRREELQERWPSANAAVSFKESVKPIRVRERIEAVAHAHEELSDVELAAKYDAIEYIDVVREVRSGPAPPVVGSFRLSPPEWMTADWEVVSVTVDGEEYNASGGGSIEMVTNVDYADRFDFIRPEWYRCDCGVRLHGEQMARHLGHAHGFEEKSKARGAVSAGMGYPDRYGDADRARSYGSDESGGSKGNVSWICSDCNCGVRIGNNCPGCGQSEPSDAKRV